MSLTIGTLGFQCPIQHLTELSDLIQGILIMERRSLQINNYLQNSRPNIERVVLGRELGCCVYTILGNFFKDEQEHRYSAFGNTYLKYRKIVIEWMIDVCDYFGLHATTTHAAIAYLDRLQPNEKYSRFEWQMLAICCILIAAKYNESEEDVPDLPTLEEITQQNISNDAVLNYELWALQRIGWTLSARTSMAFLSCFSTAGVLFRSDKISGVLLENAEFDARQLEKHFISLASMCVIDETFKPIHCSQLAAAIVLYTRRLLKISPDWCNELIQLTTYESHKLLHIVDKLSVAHAADKRLESSIGSPLSSLSTTPSTPDTRSATDDKSKRGEPDAASVEEIFTPNGKLVSSSTPTPSPYSVAEMIDTV